MVVKHLKCNVNLLFVRSFGVSAEEETSRLSRKEGKKSG